MLGLIDGKILRLLTPPFWLITFLACSCEYCSSANDFCYFSGSRGLLSNFVGLDGSLRSSEPFYTLICDCCIF
jgi:hypothetical protein